MGLDHCLGKLLHEYRLYHQQDNNELYMDCHFTHRTPKPFDHFKETISKALLFHLLICIQDNSS